MRIIGTDWGHLAHGLICVKFGTGAFFVILLEFFLKSGIKFFEILNFHSHLFSGDGSDSFGSFIESFDNGLIALFSSILFTKMSIHFFPENIDNKILIIDLFIELFDEFAAFMLFGESFNGGFLFFEDLNGVEERLDFFVMNFLHAWH